MSRGAKSSITHEYTQPSTEYLFTDVDRGRVTNKNLSGFFTRPAYYGTAICPEAEAAAYEGRRLNAKRAGDRTTQLREDRRTAEGHKPQSLER